MFGTGKQRRQTGSGKARCGAGTACRSLPEAPLRFPSHALHDALLRFRICSPVPLETYHDNPNINITTSLLHPSHSLLCCPHTTHRTNKTPGLQLPRRPLLHRHAPLPHPHLRRRPLRLGPQHPLQLSLALRLLPASKMGQVLMRLGIRLPDAQGLHLYARRPFLLL